MDKNLKVVLPLKSISASSEDYIEAILELSEENENVRSVDIANKLLVSRASVNRAIGILREKGYINHERYSDISLTDKGKVAAKEIIDTHKTIKKFLIEILFVNEQTAERDACKMEHNISSETLKKLKSYIKNINKERNL